MVAYTGIETVSNMAEEARDPDEDVPRSVNYVLLAVLGIFTGISIISLMALPVTQDAAGHYSTLLGTKYQNDPVLGIVSALPLGHELQTVLRYYVGVLAATILVIATNAGLIGISRLSWSLAKHRQLPTIFASVHPRYRTPWFTIALFSVLATILLIPGKTDFLGNLYSFGAMLSFTTAHVAIIALRYKQPDAGRPYRVPWNVRFRGGSLPLGAVLGAIGTFTAWVSVVALHKEARTVGIGWMVLGMVGYFWYRHSQGLDPKAQYTIGARAAPEGVAELAYRSALVPIFGDDVSAVALRRAAKLVGEDAIVDAVYVIEVPPQLSLDAGMREEEQRAVALLDAARIRARESKLKLRTGVIRTRNAGAALVEEARSRGSEIVYFDMAHAPSQERVFGPITSALLRERPCRIVIETVPPATREPSVVRVDSNGQQVGAGRAHNGRVEPPAKVAGPQ
jgi:APA family basic amino acid/polyamine antiporter